jgi:hypothetical protein
VDPVEPTALREPKPWRLRLGTWLIRMAARVLGVPLVLKVEPEAMPAVKLPKVTEYLQLDGEFEGSPRKWRRWYRRHRIVEREP